MEALDELKTAFREVLEEVGIVKPERDQTEGWDVSEQDYDSSQIIPAYSAGDDPISVQIVSETPTVVVQRGSLTWGGQSTIVGSTPQLIVGRDARRRSVTIKNLSMNPIALGAGENVKYVAAPGFGSAILPAGDAVVLHTRGDIWAVAASTSTGEGVSIYQIFDDGQ